MGDNGAHIFIPFIGLAANVLVQISVFRFFPGTGLLRSVFLGFACGFLVSILIRPDLISASNIAIYVLSGYCYFHFVNMGETARRVRILIELKDARQGLSLREILERYNFKDVIERRIVRLVNNGQVICKGGKYYIGNSAMLAIAGFLAAVKHVIFGRMP
ncbi:MAG: hypothetical protein PHX64_00305 [Candidatus Omnitrophica bacterium]|nr:hypothetical protein [Candidatus Omnitrophota bacterium]MDD5310181.1 hypothetical protein [Candidatus Omnitrophota bacterium]MDD5546242.1 hypothetical protein [Candidatus Omnitrophota bacterium]